MKQAPWCNSRYKYQLVLGQIDYLSKFNWFISIGPTPQQPPIISAPASIHSFTNFLLNPAVALPVLISRIYIF